MATGYRDVLIQCPFYLGEDGLVLRCEGLVGAVTLHRFKNSARKTDHMDKCCRNDYCGCRLYQALNAGYDARGIKTE